MKKLFISLQLIGLLLSFADLFPTLELPASPDALRIPAFSDPDPVLKQKAYEVLKSKCNVCHKKQNPFKIFSLRNMDRHAPKIYKQVFVYRRMPKGDKIKLTDEEYQTLKSWLTSKNIF